VSHWAGTMGPGGEHRRRRIGAVRLPFALLLLVLGCATAGPPPVLELSFAPTLGIEPDSMLRRPSGVWVRDIAVGTGVPITAGDQVEVRYTVYLTDGTRVDGTGGDDPNRVFRYGRGEIIAGWDDGMQGMRVGGRRTLVIPPALAYGARRRGNIPPQSTLVVTLQLIDIVR